LLNNTYTTRTIILIIPNGLMIILTITKAIPECDEYTTTPSLSHEIRIFKKFEIVT